ncbi:Uncharacterised protein [Klebsiella pneumoniae]|nr:hypothetical protein Y880_0575201 [Pseudomonas aeruginosa PAK]SVJ50832.1 Uncharacterised protein [Klebsiella pneumoniae]
MGGVGQLEHARGVAALGQGEDHPRRGVDRRVQATGHGDQYHQVDDQLGVRDVQQLQGALVGADLDQQRVVPRHDGDHDEDRHQVEQADPPDHRVGGAGDLLRRVLGLGGGDGDDLGAHEAEHGRQQGAEHRAVAVRHEAAVARHQAGQAADLTLRQAADDGHRAEHDEGDDGDHLEQREPELELAVAGHAEEVGDGEQEGHREGEDPGVDGREPGVEDGRGGDRFEWDHQHPEPPVEPADGETGPAADGAVGVGGEGTGIGGGDRHFAEHAHDQHHQGAGDQVGEQGGRAGGGDGMAGADEQAGADHPGDRQHGDVALFQAGRERGVALVRQL